MLFIFHVTCRGNDRRVIFRDDHDRARFLEQLRSASEIFSVRVHAYVLMSNHFHLIVETPKANLSEFMRQFNISYTGYYNRRHRRIGHLSQGRFKAIVVDKDSYLLELSRYVHLNPIRIKSKMQRPEVVLLEKSFSIDRAAFLGTSTEKDRTPGSRTRRCSAT